MCVYTYLIHYVIHIYMKIYILNLPMIRCCCRHRRCVYIYRYVQIHQYTDMNVRINMNVHRHENMYIKSPRDSLLLSASQMYVYL